MWKRWQSVACWLTIPLLFFLAWLSQGAGFDQLQRMRQLERLPRTDVISALSGEIHLEGQAVEPTELLRAPFSNVQCLYYLYTVEERRIDSDGDVRWVQIQRETDRVDEFYLEDTTGRIPIRPLGASISVSRYQERVGDLRHTEYRLDPNDTVFVFGYVRRPLEQPFVEFQTSALYTPIISTQGEQQARGSMASTSLVLSFLALMTASVAVMLACWVLNVHRLLTFLSAVSFVQGVGLLYLGLTMLQFDLQSSHARTLGHLERAQTEIQHLLSLEDISWSGDWDDVNVFHENGTAGQLPPTTRARIQSIYGTAAAAISRFNEIQARFPERVLSRYWEVRPITELPLASAFSPRVDQRRVIEMVPLNWWITAFMLPLGVAAAVIFPWLGFRKIHEKRYIENIPTSATVGLAYGPAELKGVGRKEHQLLRGPVSGADCLYYHYQVKRRTGAGDNESWVTIADETMQEIFVCQDDHGLAPVDLANAEIHSTHEYITTYAYQPDEPSSTPNRMFSVAEPSSKPKGKPDGMFSTSLITGEPDCMATEVSLHPGDDLYILGSAIIDERTGDRLKIGSDGTDFPFIVANWTEDQLMGRKVRRALGFLNLGLNGLVLSGLTIAGATASYSPTNFLLAAFIAPVFLGTCFIVLMYNDLQFVRQRVTRAWSNIDVSLKKRADLVPSLDAVAKEYLAYETELHKGISRMRAQLQRRLDPNEADELITAEKGVVARLFATAEQDPDLKSHELTRSLLDKLTTLENEISLMRVGYNDSVERHNTRIQRFPEVILAKVLGYDEAQPLQSDFGPIQPTEKADG